MILPKKYYKIISIIPLIIVFIIVGSILQIRSKQASAQSQSTQSASSNTIVSVAFHFDGIDALNNSQPLSTQRQVFLDFYRAGKDDWSNDPSGAKAFIRVRAIVNFDNDPSSPTYGYFTGNTSISIDQADTFDILAKSSEATLRKAIPAIAIAPGKTVALPLINLTAGDIDNDNVISILDYNILRNCFGNNANLSQCTDPNKTKKDGYKWTLYSDLIDIGGIEGVSYNLIIKNFGKNGDGGIGVYTFKEKNNPSPTLTPTEPPNPSSTVTPTMQPGIPKTPIMGTDPWPTYVDDNNFLNQAYFMKVADFMHTQKFPVWDGTPRTMQEVGYIYDTIDDVWGGKRTSAGLQPNLVYYPKMTDPNPSIGLIAHVHRLGLRIGLYTSVGEVTCFNSPQGPIPGSLGHEAVDGAQFQKWGVDYMKLDWCGSKVQYDSAWDEADMKTWRKALGPNIGMAMNTGGAGNPWSWASSDNSVNAFRISASIKDWRNGPKVTDQWSGGRGSVMGIIDDVGPSYLQQSHAAPYHWSDAGYMHGGVNLTLDESKSEFSMWAMVTSPLIVGVDVTQMKSGDIASQVIFNTEVIAIDQDPLIVQATKKTAVNGVEVWEKSLANNQYAVAFLNTNGSSTSITIPNVSALGIPSTFHARDLWKHQDLGPFSGTFTTGSIPPHGTLLLRIK